MAKKLLISSLFYFCLLQSTAVFGHHTHKEIIINHADIFLYLLNEHNFSLWQAADEKISSKIGRRQIKRDISSCFSQIKVDKTPCRSHEELLGFLTQMGIKQEKELIDTKAFLQRFAQLPTVEFEIKPFLIDIINGIEEIIKSHFDDHHYNYRKSISDRFITSTPFIFIVMSYNENGTIRLFGAPNALQDFLYPDDTDDDIDYISLYSPTISQSSKLFVTLTAFVSLFIPSIQIKFPSLTARYGEQQMQQLHIESTYASIGLSPEASPAAVKKTCNGLYLQLHPDKNPNSNAEKYREVRTNCELLLQKK